jgi:acylphosphatase
MQFRHYLVSGRVQKVGFRDFTQRCAGDLDLTGWVRNLRDGRVEILACGTGEALDEFEGLIKKGPLFAKVASIDKRAVDLKTNFFDFRVNETWETPWSENS